MGRCLQRLGAVCCLYRGVTMDESTKALLAAIAAAPFLYFILVVVMSF